MKRCPKCKGKGLIGPNHTPWSPCTRCNGNVRKKVKDEDRYTGPRGSGFIKA